VPTAGFAPTVFGVEMNADSGRLWMIKWTIRIGPLKYEILTQPPNSDVQGVVHLISGEKRGTLVECAIAIELEVTALRALLPNA
jgi:hypothetical protein